MSPLFQDPFFIARLSALYAPQPWPFAEQHAEAIEQNWHTLLSSKPRLFNGTVLIARQWQWQDETMTLGYSPVPYAAFLYYMRSGMADASAVNAFAMTALCTADNALVLARMADHTANAGKIYFPSGMPDMADVSGGTVDLEGNARREFVEETGLAADEVTWADGWYCFAAPLRLALFKPARSALPAVELLRHLEKRSAQTDGELSNFIALHASHGITDAMPSFVQDYIRWWFDAGGARAVMDSRNGS